jgi:hypothetical protein
MGARWRRMLPDPACALVLGNWALLLIVRALPGAPPHDGIRLLLPSFAFLAILAASGATGLRARIRSRAAGWGAVALLLAGSASSVVWYFPQCLSYYNLVAGGVRGALEMGMEPAYWWDGLDREALTWLRANTREGEKIAFSRISEANLRLLVGWGELPRGAQPSAPGEYRWYVLQHRQSAMTQADHELLRAPPAFLRTIRPSDRGIGAWRLDVPLVLVYPFSDLQEIARRRAPAPRGPVSPD